MAKLLGTHRGEDRRFVDEAPLGEWIGDLSSEATLHKRKRKKKGKKSLYDQYLADSGSDRSNSESDNDLENIAEYDEFVVGMDINILIQQTVQNVIQSVCLEQEDGLTTFGDHELTCFAAAVKHNSSIVSLQIRYLDVSDVSLVPLCNALKSHPSLRALDLSGTRGGEATSKALCELVCNNPNIIFARLDDTIVSPKDSDVIQEATLYNAMVCPDPTNNPFHLGLLRKISAMEEEQQRYQEQLQAKSWLFSSAGQRGEDPAKKKAKKVVVVTTGASKVGAEVCAQYVQGKCPYGSRCKYYHPERTAALTNAVASSQFLKQDDNSMSDSRSIATMASTLSSRRRLQSRLRASHFTLSGDPTASASSARSVEDEDVGESHSPSNFSTILALWALSTTVAVCGATLAFLW